MNARGVPRAPISRTAATGLFGLIRGVTEIPAPAGRPTRMPTIRVVFDIADVGLKR
jgi:hypothetical protein